MSISPNKDAVEPTHTIDLPVIVVADDVHMRYCASFVIDGKPDRSLYGEYRVGDSFSDTEKKQQLAVDDLRRKLIEILAAHSST